MTNKRARATHARGEMHNPLERRAELFTLDKSLALLMRDMHRAFSKQLERRISVYGITHNMWFYLRLLWESGGATQGELSEQLGIRGPTTVQTLTELEQKQLVRRRRDPADKRKVIVELTPRGVDLKHKLLVFAVEVQDLALADVSEEERVLFLDVLQRMRTALQAPASIDPGN